MHKKHLSANDNVDEPPTSTGSYQKDNMWFHPLVI